MSASLGHGGAALDALQANLEAMARKNGRMEFAHELAQWAVKNREQLPPHLREELSEMILKAGANA